jgi:hypothetical protein
VIWVALLVIALAAPAIWAWHMSGRHLAAATEAEQRRVLRRAVAVSAGVGVVILTLGAVGFVLTGHNWMVLVLVWSAGLLHLGLLGRVLRRAQRRNGRTRAVH